MTSLLYRVYSAFMPTTVEKRGDAIRFGVLGAAKIAPFALMLPAKSHPEIIVQAVSARNRSRAEEFAKKHGIPEVRDSYEDIINDPNTDAIFIPLPNSLHVEWAVRAIRAGKHVLVEKPSVSNSKEAEILFNLPELSKRGAPILLEVSHNRFHPSLHLFRTFINPADVVHVHTDSMVPWVITSADGIEFNYNLSGGSMMMLGTYNFGVLRMIFDDEPVECLSCETSVLGDGVHDQCDSDFKAQFLFPNGGIGEATTSLRDRQEKVMTRVVTLHGFLHAIFWHRIDVEDSYVIRNKADGRPIEKWVKSKTHKAYSFKDAGGDFSNSSGETWWMSYRYMLEAFVNRIKGRSTQYWVTGQDSINQIKMIDIAYEKSGLGLRPTSSFR